MTHTPTHKTRTTHRFDRYADVRAALADPALVPEPPAADAGPAGASVAWLRATVARFSSGEPHRRRRALVEAELARLDPAALRQAAAAGPEGGGVRTRVVHTLAEALDMPEPEAVAEAVLVIAGGYFGGGATGADAMADVAAAPGPGTAAAVADEAGVGAPRDAMADVAAGTAVDAAAGVTAAKAVDAARGTTASAAGGPSAGAARGTTVGAAGRTVADDAVAQLIARLAPAPADEAALEAAANRIGLLVQACEATAALVEAVADGGDVPVARVLQETPPVRITRRVAATATRIAGREIGEGDAVVLDLAVANRAHPVPLTFGAPPRVCPGRRHALALADGLLRRPLTPFARLHHQPTPLLLPNAWDHASAAALAAHGFEAIGTTSLGVAAAAGLPDGAAATVDATVALVRRLGRLGQGSFLLTVDAEGGFSDDPAEVAALARELYDAGAAGINLEDGRPDGTLAPAEVHAAKIAAAKAAVPGLFVNARTDTHWLDREQEETPTRLASYEQAGADGVFVPGLSDPDGIAALTATLVVPLNILYTPTGPTLAELAALGVRRVSLGSLLYRAALAATVTTATAVRDGRSTVPGVLSYAEVQSYSN